MRRRPLPALHALAGILLLGFLVAPLLALIGALPSTRLADLADIATLQALGVSVFAATGATLVDAVLGIPLALWLARSDSRWRHLVTAAVLLPLGIPPVVGGLVLVLWLGPQNWLGGLSPLNTLVGTILAQMFVAAPFVVISARAAFLAVDPELEDAARALGCTPAQAIWRVVLPAARRGLAAGVVLGWVRCIGEFGATAVVAYHPYTLPTLTYVRLTGEGIPTALPAGALLALVGAGAAAGLLWLDTRRARSRRPPAGEEPAPAGPLAWIEAPVAARAGMRARVELELRGFQLHVDFSAPPGVTALLGSSGAGKSLSLRAIAGLIQPDRGRILLGERLLLDTDQGTDLPPEQRRLGYVAQSDALFEHLDLERNIAFSLRGLDPPEAQRRVRELLAVFGLERVRHSLPQRTSGGEHQRAALARALAATPDALLLDEPFSDLDAPLRRRLRRLVRSLFERTGIPVLLATHDREDVLDVADHVIVLHAGRVVQAGPLEELLRRPARRSVAELLGIPNVLPVRELAPDGDGRVLVRTEWGNLKVAAPLEPADVWEVAVPADAIVLDPSGRDVRVAATRPASVGWTVWLGREPEGELLEAAVPPTGMAGKPFPGDHCGIVLDGSRCHLMPRS